MVELFGSSDAKTLEAAETGIKAEAWRVAETRPGVLVVLEGMRNVFLVPQPQGGRQERPLPTKQFCYLGHFTRPSLEVLEAEDAVVPRDVRDFLRRVVEEDEEWKETEKLGVGGKMPGLTRLKRKKCSDLYF